MADTSTAQSLSLDRSRVVAPVSARVHDVGELSIVQGAPVPGLFVVAGGVLREGAVSEEGRWIVHDLHTVGSVFGELVPGRPSAVSVRAITMSWVALLRPADLDALVRGRPDLARWLFGRVDRRVRRAQAAAEHLTWLDAAERLERRLIDLARSCGRRVPGGVEITPLLTQDELAASIGTIRETVNRAAVAMVADGRLRLENRRYVVRDRLLAARGREAESGWVSGGT